MGWKNGRRPSDAFHFPTEGRLVPEVDAALDDVADAVFDASQDTRQGGVPVDSGDLKKSGHVVRQLLRKKVVYQTSYAEKVEEWPSERPGHPYLRPAHERESAWALGRMKEAYRLAIA